MPTGTVHLHRVLRTTPDKVYRAFTHGAALAKWLPPHGFICHVHHFDGKVGGTFKMSFENFSTGHRHSFGGEYVKLTPGEVVEYTKLMAESREQALDRMVEEAKKLGAHAIVGVRFSTSEVMNNAAEVLAYGTAVRLEP